MTLAIGFLIFLLGAVTFVGWWPATMFFLKGFVSFSLLFWGFMALMVGYSERNAKKQFEKAVNDDRNDKKEAAPSKEETAAAEADVSEADSE